LAGQPAGLARQLAPERTPGPIAGRCKRIAPLLDECHRRGGGRLRQGNMRGAPTAQVVAPEESLSVGDTLLAAGAEYEAGLLVISPRQSAIPAQVARRRQRYGGLAHPPKAKSETDCQVFEESGPRGREYFVADGLTSSSHSAMNRCAASTVANPSAIPNR
jgi:hypothetical protein